MIMYSINLIHTQTHTHIPHKKTAKHTNKTRENIYILEKYRYNLTSLNYTQPQQQHTLYNSIYYNLYIFKI